MSDEKLWLWKNFVDDKSEYWAFNSLYPRRANGDPLVFGEPCGYALVKPCANPDTHITTAPVINETADSVSKREAECSAAFEIEERKGYTDLSLMPDGRYRYDSVRNRWIGFKRAWNRTPAKPEAVDEFTLLGVLADIRQKTGVGDKVMLSELADVLTAKINNAKNDTENPDNGNHPPHPLSGEARERAVDDTALYGLACKLKVAATDYKKGSTTFLVMDLLRPYLKPPAAPLSGDERGKAVEAMAKAIIIACGDNPELDIMGEPLWRTAVEQAEAALSALEEMKGA